MAIRLTDERWAHVAEEHCELTDEDVIVRYEGEEVVGLTVLHASER